MRSIGDTERAMSRVVPKIVGVVSALAELDALVPKASSLPVDWVEVRFDQFPASEWSSAHGAIDALEAAGKTVLATIRLRSDGGAHEPDDEARVDAFRVLLDHASAIDVEVDSVHARALVDLAHEKRRIAVVSHHDFGATPSLDSLRAIEARARSTGADIVKVSTMVRELGDHDALLGLLAEHRDGSLCVIGMGALGISLRAYAPSVGSALAYAYLDRPAAPGQLAASALAHFLELVGAR